MLTICSESLPKNQASYIAFRLAFLDTLERITLARQLGEIASRQFGYLAEVPFLKAVAPQVQLDLLAATWSKHRARARYEADLVDESVVYAVCESSARLVEQQPETARRFLGGGPVDVRRSMKGSLSAKLRGLHLSLSNEGDFLVISQFEDMPPEEAAPLKQKLGLDPARLEPMFEVLGRWNASNELTARLAGLLSQKEIAGVVNTLQARTPHAEH